MNTATMNRQQVQLRTNIRAAFLTSGTDEITNYMLAFATNSFTCQVLREMLDECERAGVSNFGEVPF